MLAVALETALLAVLTRFGDFSKHHHAAIFVALFLVASGAYFTAVSFWTKLFRCHSERSGAQRNAVEESRGTSTRPDLKRPEAPRDPSTPLRSARDDTFIIWFWIIAILLRLAVFTMPPADDVWRYIWEGRIQLHGFSPYAMSPQAEELRPLRDALWTHINHPDFATIYPPLAQMSFDALAAVSESPWFFKLVFTLADLATVWILLRLCRHSERSGAQRNEVEESRGASGSVDLKPPEAPRDPSTSLRYARDDGLSSAAWYAWNPLVVCAFAGAGHYDSMMLAPLLAAVLALQKSRVASSCAWLGIAIAAKIVPLFLLPVWFFAAGKKRAWTLIAIAIPWALTLPYGGWAAVQKPLTNFTNVARFNDVFWWLTEATLWPNPSQRNERYTVVLACAAALLAFIFRRDWRRGILWVLGAALLLSPVLHPWYLTWILPFACWRRAWPWVAFSCSVVIGLLVWERGPFWGQWQMTWQLRTVELLAPAAVLAATLFQRKRAIE